ncbi:MAG TPA: DUF6485 family protein [Nitrospirota bacterium]|jgi:hypothetical protein
MRNCTVEKNKKNCTCTYGPCSRKGVCCECIVYHRRSGELPGCLFPAAAEKTYDRSVQAFIKAHTKK